MASITILIVVVAAILTAVIFGLAWLGYSSCLKAYRAEVEQGKHDIEILNQFYNKNTNKKLITVIWYVLGIILIITLIGLLAVSFTYQASGQAFSINGNSAFVIKSGSMSKFYNDKLAEDYSNLGYDSSLQFKVGDICIFEKVEELKLGDVYGYLYDNKIITHRLVGIEDGKYIFRGDNNPSNDQILVPQENIVYHYTGQKVPQIGLFILYAQSFYGAWTLLCIIGITISSDIVLRKIHQINKQRAEEVHYEI